MVCELWELNQYTIDCAKTYIILHETQRNTKTLQILRLRILQEKIWKCLDIQLNRKHVTGSCIPLTTPMSHTPGDKNTSNESHTTAKKRPYTQTRNLKNIWNRQIWMWENAWQPTTPPKKRKQVGKAYILLIPTFERRGIWKPDSVNTFNHVSYSPLGPFSKVRPRQTQE